MNDSADDRARRAVVAALIEFSSSPAYHDRADAGRALASFADTPDARQPLMELLLDNADTLVTYATAESLLRRLDPAGLAPIAAVLADADFNHVTWIGAAVHHVLGVFAADRDAAALVCEKLRLDPDERVRRGVDFLLAMVVEIDPILHPASDDATVP